MKRMPVVRACVCLAALQVVAASEAPIAFDVVDGISTLITPEAIASLNKTRVGIMGEWDDAACCTRSRICVGWSGVVHRGLVGMRVVGETPRIPFSFVEEVECTHVCV
jgi:hypothetical protein